MKGFTLIELLVVVVIIGILASIALPQYELVVEKSRATEAMINAKAIQDACQRHLQEYPDDTCNNFKKIADVQLQNGSSGEKFFRTDNFCYEFKDSGIVVSRKGSGNRLSGVAGTDLYVITYPTVPGSAPTAEGCDNTDYAQVCKLFTN